MHEEKDFLNQRFEGSSRSRSGEIALHRLGYASQNLRKDRGIMKSLKIQKLNFRPLPLDLLTTCYPDHNRIQGDSVFFNRDWVGNTILAVEAISHLSSLKTMLMTTLPLEIAGNKLDWTVYLSDDLSNLDRGRHLITVTITAKMTSPELRYHHSNPKVTNDKFCCRGNKT